MVQSGCREASDSCAAIPSVRVATGRSLYTVEGIRSRRLIDGRTCPAVPPTMLYITCPVSTRRRQIVWQPAIVNRAKRRGSRRLLAAVDHPALRDGLIALFLFVLPWAALFQVRRYHWDNGTMVGVVAALAATSIGLSTLWLTWAALREAKHPQNNADGLNLGRVADQLATAVGAQWEAEAAIRRLNDPYPLPVSWNAADFSLTDDWNSLVRLARQGAGWPPPPPWEAWAAGPGDLAGEGDQLADVLSRVPTGRLAVLGEPGAGKTMLMVRLVLDLLRRRDSGRPVPFLVSAATWDPAEQSMREWLETQLLIDHPALARPVPANPAGSTQAAALLTAGLILPILDGLDEIPERVRGPAISRINAALRPGEQLVATCRSKEYRDAVRPQDGLEVTFRSAAAVQLRPLDADAVADYLCDDAAGPAARGRWAPVLATLGTGAPAAEALTTPLMVGLARIIYNPGPGGAPEALRDPSELCSPALRDRVAVESLLFDAFVPAAYRSGVPARWTAQKAERCLEFLARYLEYQAASTDLAWWQVRRAMPGAVFIIFPALMATFWVLLCVGITATFKTAVIMALVFGITTALLAGFIARRDSFRTPSRGIRWHSPVKRRYLPKSCFLWIVLLALVVVLYVFVFILIVITGLEGAPADLNKATDPLVTFRTDRRVAISWGLVFGIASALLIGYFEGGSDLPLGVTIGLVCLGTFGLIGALATARWPFYWISCIWLMLRHRSPGPLMSFLADAHQRGILRQSGAVYQFRHIELQHRLASRNAGDYKARDRNQQ